MEVPRLAFLCEQNLIEQQALAPALCNLRRPDPPERTAHPHRALLHHGIANGHPASVPLDDPGIAPLPPEPSRL